MALNLSLQNFSGLVQGMAAQAQASARGLLDLTVGSVLRALIEANASAALWLQWLIVLCMQRQRLATSVGTDVDSFVNDYTMTRLAGNAATGAVTLSRFSAAATALIPAGTTVRTTDGSQTFTIPADPTHSLWSVGLNGFLLPVNTFSATLNCICQNVGIQGNVQAGTITLLGSALAGIDTASNASAFTTGFDAESDAAVKLRFPNFIAGLSKATLAAVSSAIQGVQQGLTFVIQTNQTPDGTFTPGTFVVTVDDGTGFPSTNLKSRVFTAVDQVRALCESFTVQSPSVTTAAIVMTIAVAPGVSKPTVAAAITSAVTAYVNGLGVGAALNFYVISKLAYDAVSAGQVTAVSAVTVNGLSGDAGTITPAANGVIKISSVSVN